MTGFGHMDNVAAEPCEPKEATPIQRLFQMVVVTAIGDALGHVKEGSREMRSARQWLLNSPDFCNACDIAGWDAESLRERLKRLIEQGFKSRMLSDTGHKIRQVRMLDK